MVIKKLYIKVVLKMIKDMELVDSNSTNNHSMIKI